MTEDNIICSKTMALNNIMVAMKESGTLMDININKEAIHGIQVFGSMCLEVIMYCQLKFSAVDAGKAPAWKALNSAQGFSQVATHSSPATLRFFLYVYYCSAEVVLAQGAFRW